MLQRIWRIKMKFKKTLILIASIIILGAIIFLVSNKSAKKQDMVPTNPLVPATQTPINITVIPPQAKITNERLKNTIDKALKEAQGTYGIVIRNLNTKEEYYLNEHREFDTASLYKLWVMATAFTQIQSGQLKENSILSQNIQVLNNKFNIGSESTELTEGTITVSVKEALNKMITISDNYAALLLSEKVRLSNVSDFLKKNGLIESRLGEPPKTTPYDIALFLEKLYKNELANEDNTQKMIELLSRQTLNNKLPKYLPSNLSIAHKTGELGYFTHDAGIVFTNKDEYLIVVLSESDNPSGAEERIAEISKAVYDYFEEKDIEL
ncbi:hypothetical protein COV53_04395 [Candidatus Gottesmanbacteria bacterium CG11_big_fil_rev_8_21_14_0_20_37_11]|uniref:Beta-lactamase class A catalytic domain-containing protein n=3 Tax=Candidatus Gottesmaniibacteriota TaxID=1752720 RepID=A0A2M7RS34_9BACT|nr:MAG: hypothetical protein COX23_03450 [Candidatus Gottesmanbacteria bacterium CG23_combo_of_CG06-09_8_20_14_all_37_19]PIR08177.1 MAG: hypothetical protein COV53_04395 [Candidatus Gottesmanbacteria bacterium CG11_big_fil_rev_8_21_14_0_20_37_11]PIZ03113.1 MAG: hypothetical protein COY59_01235 [Candidatus Gottesmanbacteria bacterium CG_4_10_14_0_8_um_filter_37_24]